MTTIENMLFLWRDYSVLKEVLLRKLAKYTMFGMVGVDDGEVPPVPIPNTEVKLTCAEDSWLETACENR